MIPCNINNVYLYCNNCETLQVGHNTLKRRQHLAAVGACLRSQDSVKSMNMITIDGKEKCACVWDGFVCSEMMLMF